MSVLVGQFYGSIWWYLMCGVLAAIAIGVFVYLQKQKKDEED
jgi:hypothetical protein